MIWLSPKNHLSGCTVIPKAILIFAFFFTPPVLGQDAQAEMFNQISRFEIFVGPSIVHGTIDGIDSEVSKIRFTGGMRVIRYLSRMFEIEGRLSFDRKGVFTDNTGDWDGSSVARFIEDIDLNYGTATFLQRFTFGKKRLIYLGAGPYFSILFSEKETEEVYLDGYLFERIVSRRKGGENFKGTDVGISTIAGVTMGITEKMRGTVSIEYSRGLVSVYETTTIRNQAIALVLAISF